MKKQIMKRMELLVALALAASACGDGDDAAKPESDDDDGASVAASKSALEARAYIVSKLSDELTVIDLKKLEIIAQVRTLGEGRWQDVCARWHKTTPRRD